MRSIEEKEITSNSSTINFEFPKGNGGSNAPASHKRHHHHHPHRTSLRKPAPSKWDDAQKWLVGLSRGGEKGVAKAKPRNSNADDTRLITQTPRQETEDSFAGEEVVEKAENVGNPSVQYDVETKNIDHEESFWHANKSVVAAESVIIGARSVCLRDMGTEMTPAASQEPSRTTTPIRAATPVGPRSPVNSRSSTPVRPQQRGGNHQVDVPAMDAKAAQASPLGRANASTRYSGGTTGYDRSQGGVTGNHNAENGNSMKMNPLESRALAWDEAERTKYIARYKREEVKIQAWENHEKRKAEMKLKMIEVKAERIRARAQEKYANKVAATMRIAEEKRANAEAKLNEKAVRTSEKTDYIRRTGHLPSSFSFSLPSFCW